MVTSLENISTLQQLPIARTPISPLCRFSLYSHRDLNPNDPHRPQDFKSCVSTIPPWEHFVQQRGVEPRGILTEIGFTDRRCISHQHPLLHFNCSIMSVFVEDATIDIVREDCKSSGLPLSLIPQFIVIPEGFEPPTYRLEGSCSVPWATGPSCGLYWVRTSAFSDYESEAFTNLAKSPFYLSQMSASNWRCLFTRQVVYQTNQIWQYCRRRWIRTIV